MAGSRAEAPAHEWSVELLRGVAALLVVATHYLPLAHVDSGLLRFAYTGVDLFFVISGFVFAAYIHGKPLALGPHLVRRAFRIYPLYLAALAAYVVLRVANGQPADYLWQHLLFLQTLQTREIAFYYNPAFWSLPPEVEFAVVLPLLAWVASRSTRAVMLTAAGSLALHLLIAFNTSATVDGWTVLAVHLPGVFVEFMLGALVWRILTRHALRRWQRVALVAAGLATWLVFARIFVVLDDPGVIAHPLLRGNMGLAAAVAYALVMCGWVGAVSHAPAWLKGLALVCGNLSYGVYLFHNALPQVLGPLAARLPGPLFIGLCFGATVAVAALLHRVVEAPARRWGRRMAASLEAAQAPAWRPARGKG